MPLLQINTGSLANDGTGDTLRTAIAKTNANFLYLSSSIAAKGFPHTIAKGRAIISGSFVLTGSISSSGDLQVGDVYADNITMKGGFKANGSVRTDTLHVNYLTASDDYYEDVDEPYGRPPTLRLSGSGDEAPSVISLDIWGIPAWRLQANTMSLAPADLIYPLPTVGPKGGSFSVSSVMFSTGDASRGPFEVKFFSTNDGGAESTRVGLGSPVSDNEFFRLGNTSILKAKQYVFPGVTTTSNANNMLKYKNFGGTKVCLSH
jgi:hypothetical protein